MKIADMTLRVAALSALDKAVKAENAATRADVLEALTDFHETTGAKSLDVKLPDFGKVGTVSLSFAKGGIEATDTEAIDAYIAENYPAAVVEIPARREVSSAFRAELLSRLAFTGEGGAYDPDTGMEVPGVVAKAPGTDPKSFSVRLTPEGSEAIIQAFLRGDLAELGGIAPQALPEGDAA